MLWEHKQDKCFHSFFEFSQTFMNVSAFNSIETQRICFLFLLENATMKKGKQLV